MKFVDISTFIKDTQLLFHILDEVVEEVGVSLVVQVVIDNTRAYNKTTKMMLMEKNSNFTGLYMLFIVYI